MKTPYILSPSSRDQALKTISTRRIPEYEVGPLRNGSTDGHGTMSEGGKHSSRASSPLGEESHGEDEGPDLSMGMGRMGEGEGVSIIDYLRLQS